MNKKIRNICCFTGLGVCVLFEGCGSVPPRPEPQAEVMTPVYVAGVDVGQSRIQDVRNPEGVEVYSVGRYIDPNNSHIMYEKNTIYRQKQTSSWNTRPNPPIKLSDDSNAVGHINSANDKPLYAELENRIYRYNDATKEYTKKYANMIKSGAEKIAKSTAQVKQVIEQNKKLIEEQKKLNNKISEQDKIIKEIGEESLEHPSENESEAGSWVPISKDNNKTLPWTLD